MANNLKVMLSDPKSRNGILVLGMFCLVGTVAGVIIMTSGNKKNDVAGGARVSGPNTSLTARPGQSDSTEYIHKVQESNSREAAQALETGKTSVGVLSGGSNLSNVSPLDMLGDGKVVRADSIKEELEITPAAPVVLPKVDFTVQPPQTTEAYNVAPQPKFGTTEDYHILQMANSIWQAKPSRSEYNYLGQGDPLKAEAEAAQAAQSAQESNSARTNEQRTVARVGDILNAVLETGINSDEPGPILATIVSGDFKGSRLVGAAKRRNEKVIIEFSSISIPGRATSTSISAVAIDMNSMEQASTLASSVDNHYFKKYGLLFAAAFVGGYADAIRDQNTTQIITPEGGVITTRNGNKSSKDINRESLGTVGKEMGSQIKSESRNIVPTVKVNRGTAIGLLLMNDLKI